MTNIRIFAIIAASVVLTVLVMGAITRPAFAEGTRIAVCTRGFAEQKGDKDGGVPIARWLNEQIAAGHTDFIVIADNHGYAVTCAW